MSEPRKFYVGILLREGQVIGHGFSFKPIPMWLNEPAPNKDSDAASKNTASPQDANFQAVFGNFVSVIETYLRFMPITMQVAPEIAKRIGEQEIAAFARNHGIKRDDLSSPNSETYELDNKLVRDFWPRHERVIAATKGVHLLPKILIVGLISAYDAFLAALLRVVIAKHPEIVLTSQKQLTFRELLEFSSMDEARAALIEREIETVIRKGHHEQFDWMQHNFGTKLKENLKVWPSFVELCERRNLFTHSDGVVSEQYLKNCTAHKCSISGVTVGQRLDVDEKYFRRAVETIHEIGLKLCFVFWRKFSAADIDSADSAYNARCMELIQMRAYRLAEALLTFGITVPKIKDELRKMMVINLANATRLQDREGEAKKLLNSEDWSATSDEFRICVASVRGDMDAVLRLMKTLGIGMAVHKYRDWPVFRRTRENPKFLETFEGIFGEPLFTLQPDDKSVRAGENPPGSGAPETMH